MIRSPRGRRFAEPKNSRQKQRRIAARKPLSEILEERQLLASDLASSVCSGLTCTETETFAGVPDLTDAAVFDQFDPSVGILKSVNVTLEITSEGGSFEADNDSDEPATFDVNFGAEGEISSGDVGLFSAVTPVPTPVVGSVATSQGATFNLTGNDGDDVSVFNQGGTDWDSFEGATATATGSGDIDESLFSGFEGTGDFDIDYEIRQVADTTSAGGVFRQIGPVSASGSITVVYEYELHPIDPSIEIDKFVWDINGSPEITSDIDPGDEIIYGFEVTNTGDVPLSDVTVTDALPGVVIGAEVFSTTPIAEQSIFIPADGKLGPFSSTDKTLASDPFETQAWDNFSLSGQTLLKGIEWDGAYIEPFSAGITPETDFVVEIFSDASGKPDSLLYSWTLDGGLAGVSDADVTTTLLGHTAEDGGPVYNYQADLPKTHISAGNYWLSIRAFQNFPNPFPKIDPTWQWHLGSGSGDGFYTYDDVFDDPGDNGIGAVDGSPAPLGFHADKDLSFTLKGKLEVSFDGTLGVGETVVFTGTYIVTEADVMAGMVENKGTVTANDPRGGPVMDMDTEVIKIDPPEPGIEIDKYLWDINGSPFLHADILPGDELIYSFDVTNTGKTKLSNVTVTDALPGVVIDSEVAIPYVAVDQPIFIPADGNLGPFATKDMTLVSDNMEAKAWDNFTLADDTVIDRVSWAGAYIEPFADGGLVPATDFLVEFYEDNAGSVGSTIHYFTLRGGDAGVSDEDVSSTLLGHSAEDGGPVYSYDAMLPFTLFPAGEYWISITALQSFPNPAPVIDPTWQWHLGSGPGDGFYTYDDVFDDTGDGRPFPSSKSADKDLAYTLHAARLEEFDGMLDPGETVMFMGTYIVTVDDVINGEVVNKATVTADDPFDRDVMDMDTETVPIDPPESSIEIDKYLWDINGLPDLHKNIRAGDELIYSFDVTNTGETKLSNVDVTDSLPGAVFDPQVVIPFTAFEQPYFIPSDSNLGPFASVDRTVASDNQEAKAWDNFSFAEDTVVDGVSWVGAYIEPFATGDGVATPETDFLIEIWTDSSGPDSVLHTWTVSGGDAGVNDAQLHTTALGHTAKDGGPVYSYDALFPFTYLNAGDYWLSITALQTFPNSAPTIDPTWQWHVGTNPHGADGFYSYDDVFDDADDGTPFPATFQDDKDLAFTLHGARQVDFDGCLEPGETVMFMATYIVTQADVDAREVVNKGTVTADDPFGNEVMDMDTEIVEIFVPNSKIEIDKYLWDINGSPDLHTNIKEGDELIYSFDVTNTGDTKLSNVVVTDSLPDAVFDDEIVIPYVALDQPYTIPADGNLGPFSSVNRELASDPQEAKAWDNFSFVQDTVIDGISWVGAYVEPFATGDGVATPETDFLVEIWSDNSGPDAVVQSFHARGGDAGVDDVMVRTTPLGHTAEDGGPVYSYNIMFPFTYLNAGSYWISITALQTFPNAAPTIDPTWQWHLGSNPDGADGFYSYDDAFDDVGDGTPSPLVFQTGKDLAYTLHAARLTDFDGMLDPGETAMFMATYYVTAEDVEACMVVNKGTVTAVDPYGNEVMAMDEHTVHIDCAPPANPSIFIDKYLWDINGSPDLHNDIKVGDELIYGIDIVNDGDVKLSDIVVTDQVWLVEVDEEVAIPYVAFEQPAFVPSSGEVGAYSSVERDVASDPQEAKAWDNFSLSGDWTVIDAITWYGAYDEPFATGSSPETDFLIEIYGADSGKPGAVQHSFNVRGGIASVDDENVRTTLLGHTTPDGGPAYRYHAMLPFTGLVAGDYWISITALQTFPSSAPTVDPTWQWHLGSGSGDGFYTYDDAFDDAGDGSPVPANLEAGKDLAFKLHAAELIDDFDGMLDPGERVMYMARYIVRQEDIDKGVFQNDAKVVATAPDGTVLTELDWEHVDINQNPGIKIDSAPAAKNDEVATSIAGMRPMRYTVTNEGDVSLHEVVVTDEGEGNALFVGSDDGEDGVLSPGEVWVFDGMGQNGMETKVTAGTLTGDTVTDELMHEFCIAGDGDIDGDGKVAFSDFLVLSRNFGMGDADPAMGDIDCDGEVGFSDFLVLSRNFGSSAVAAQSSDAVDAAFAAASSADGDDEWLA